MRNNDKIAALALDIYDYVYTAQLLNVEHIGFAPVPPEMVSHLIVALGIMCQTNVSYDGTNTYNESIIKKSMQLVIDSSRLTSEAITEIIVYISKGVVKNDISDHVIHIITSVLHANKLIRKTLKAITSQIELVEIVTIAKSDPIKIRKLIDTLLYIGG